MWRELTRGESLLTLAAVLLALGLFLWRSRSALRNAFRHREAHAENLRRAGEEGRARVVEEETRRLGARLPLYGKILVAVSLGLGILGLTRLP